MGLLLSMFGCSRKNAASSYEEVASTVLNSRYQNTYRVEKLARKGKDSPFPEKYLSGYAYQENSPKEPIQVWVSLDKKEVLDSTDALKMRPALEEWFTGLAGEIWPGSRVLLRLSFNRYPGEVPEDCKEFYKKVSTWNDMMILLPEETDLSHMKEDILKFHKLMGSDIFGKSAYYLVSGEQAAKPREQLMNELNETHKARWEIVLGMPDHLIENLFD